MLHVKFQSEPRRQECRKSMRCACSVAEHNVETGEFLLLIFFFFFAAPKSKKPHADLSRYCTASGQK